MRARLALGVLAALLVNAATSFAVPDNWWWVCHQKGNGDYILLLVGDPSGHQNHGEEPVEAMGQPPPTCPA